MPFQTYFGEKHKQYPVVRADNIVDYQDIFVAAVAVNTTVSRNFKMRLSFKHTGLMIGIALVLLSFLFAGRQQGIYQILLLGGLVTAFIFHLTILFGKGHVKAKSSGQF